MGVLTAALWPEAVQTADVRKYARMSVLYARSRCCAVGTQAGVWRSDVAIRWNLTAKPARVDATVAFGAARTWHMDEKQCSKASCSVQRRLVQCSSRLSVCLIRLLSRQQDIGGLSTSARAALLGHLFVSILIRRTGVCVPAKPQDVPGACAEVTMLWF